VFSFFLFISLFARNSSKDGKARSERGKREEKNRKRNLELFRIMTRYHWSLSSSLSLIGVKLPRTWDSSFPNFSPIFYFRVWQSCTEIEL
jgi:hypothetical protein